MKAEDFLQELLTSLVGKKITRKYLAANSLIFHVEGELEDYRMWLEPTWHVSSPPGVLVGSRQAQVETREELDRVGRPLDRLIGQKIEAIEVDARSNDLSISVSGGFLVRTFLSDPEDDDIWHIADLNRGLKVYASPVEFDLAEMAA